MRVCEQPAKTGIRAGQSAHGTPGGFSRHRRAGEPPCDECRIAKLENDKKWIRQNPERRAAINRRWYESHHEQALEAARKRREANPGYATEWYEANRERKAATTRRWAQENAELRAEITRRWSKENPDRRAEFERKWRQANPEKVSEYARRRRARVLAAATVPFTTDQLAQKMAYWGNQCWMCGGVADSIDHVKPLAKGGPHVLANLRPACMPCNSRKSAKWEGVA